MLPLTPCTLVQEQMLEIFGSSSSDLLDTIDHNLSHGSDDSKLQLNVVYDNLPEEALAEFRQLADKKSMELLQELDAYLSKHDRDANKKSKGTGKFRAGLGVYLIEQDLLADGNNKIQGVDDEA